MNRLYGSGIIAVLRAFQRQFAGLQKKGFAVPATAPLDQYNMKMLALGRSFRWQRSFG